MSRGDEEPDYDYFEIDRVPSNSGQTQWAETDKSRLLRFKQVGDAEVWTPKSISQFKTTDDGKTIVLRVPSWWVKKQDEL